MGAETPTRAALYRLIDDLPDAELDAAYRFLSSLAHDAGLAGDAPHDAGDQPSVREATADDLRIREAITRASNLRGQGLEERRTVSGHFFKTRPAEGDPLLDALEAAPDDDEPLTTEDIAAIAEAREAADHGEIESWDTVKAELLGKG